MPSVDLHPEMDICPYSVDIAVELVTNEEIVDIVDLIDAYLLIGDEEAITLAKQNKEGIAFLHRLRAWITDMSINTETPVRTWCRGGI